VKYNLVKRLFAVVLCFGGWLRKWEGPKAVFKIYDCASPGKGYPYDPKGILVSVNINDWKIGAVKQ
jgi:hypothetical protein